MIERDPVSPDVQAILEQIANDPKSRVLRVPRLRTPPGFEPPVRDREAFFTRAEKQLVSVHRFEVADLLYQEVRRAVIEGEEAESRLLKYVRPDQTSEPPDPVTWERDARFELAAIPSEHSRKGKHGKCLSLLEQCVQATPLHRPSPVALASASLRLVPRSATRICLALALHQQGQTQSGIANLWDVIESRPSELLMSYAWQNLASLEDALGHPTESLQALQRGSLTMDKRGDVTMTWFFAALRLGDAEAAIRAGQCIGDCVPEGHGSVDAFIRVRSAMNRKAGWRAEETFLRTYNSVLKKVPEHAWRIGDALSK